MNCYLMLAENVAGAFAFPSACPTGPDALAGLSYKWGCVLDCARLAAGAGAGEEDSRGCRGDALGRRGSLACKTPAELPEGRAGPALLTLQKLQG